MLVQNNLGTGVSIKCQKENKKEMKPIFLLLMQIYVEERYIPNHTGNGVYLGHNQEGFFEGGYMT
jgi:hypothetical protein